MISTHERTYEEETRARIQLYSMQERFYRSERQILEARLRVILAERGAKRLQDGCPPGFAFDCVLEDGTTCPFYHDGQCVKAEEEQA